MRLRAVLAVMIILVTNRMVRGLVAHELMVLMRLKIVVILCCVGHLMITLGKFVMIVAVVGISVRNYVRIVMSRVHLVNHRLKVVRHSVMGILMVRQIVVRAVMVRKSVMNGNSMVRHSWVNRWRRLVQLLLVEWLDLGRSLLSLGRLGRRLRLWLLFRCLSEDFKFDISWVDRILIIVAVMLTVRIGPNTRVAMGQNRCVVLHRVLLITMLRDVVST